MVTLHVAGPDLVVSVVGLDKLWSFKSTLTIPLAHVAEAHPATEESRRTWHGLRAPGTHVPGWITAGTYYDKTGRVFWDVSNPDNAIEIALHDDRFSRLIVEVEDPAAAIELIRGASTP
ncbi:MAG TPA: hypothetical protein VME66_12895 [Candidatus Acidoferrales bacterium]|nr:hypothetical protein [Candidatus Acidoferrales bacterium]